MSTKTNTKTKVKRENEKKRLNWAAQVKLWRITYTGTCVEQKWLEKVDQAQWSHIVTRKAEDKRGGG